jgi:hypothetical protein
MGVVPRAGTHNGKCREQQEGLMLVGGLFVGWDWCTCRTKMGTNQRRRYSLLNPLQGRNLAASMGGFVEFSSGKDGSKMLQECAHSYAAR